MFFSRANYLSDIQEKVSIVKLSLNKDGLLAIPIPQGVAAHNNSPKVHFDFLLFFYTRSKRSEF